MIDYKYQGAKPIFTGTCIRTVMKDHADLRSMLVIRKNVLIFFSIGILHYLPSLMKR